MLHSTQTYRTVMGMRLKAAALALALAFGMLPASMPVRAASGVATGAQGAKSTPAASGNAAGAPNQSSAGENDQKGLWASIKETLAEIRNALSINHLLGVFSGWFIDVMTAPVRALYTGVFGTLLVVTPMEIQPLVTGPHRTAVAAAVALLMAGLAHLAWVMIRGRERPGPGNPEGKPRYAMRAGMLVLAAIAAGVSLRILDMVILAHNVGALNLSIDQGIIRADGGDFGCRMPTQAPDLSSLEAWSTDVHGCGKAVMSSIFGPSGSSGSAAKTVGETARLKDLDLAGVLLSIPYGLLFSLIGFALLLRSLALWILAIGAPVWFAIAVIQPEAAIGWVAMTLRTLFMPWVFIAAVLIHKAAVDAAFATIGVGGPADISGGEAALVALVAFTAAFAAFVWLWLIPTVKAAMAPATLAGGSVIASVAGMVGKVAGVVKVAGALGSVLPGVGGVAAAVSAGAAGVAAGAEQVRRFGENMRDAARGPKGMDRDKVWDYWRRTGGVAADRAEGWFKGTGDAPSVNQVTRAAQFVRLSEHLTETDAAAAEAFLQARGLRSTGQGYGAEEALRAVARAEDRFVDVTDPATGAVTGREIAAVFGTPGHMRGELVRYLRERGIASARAVPDGPSSEGGVAVGVVEEAEAAALVTAFWSERVFDAPSGVRMAFARVSCAPDQLDEIEAVLKRGFPHRGLPGLPETVPIHKSVVDGRGELLIPVEHMDRVEGILAAHRCALTPYWVAGPGRYVILVRGVPVVTGAPPQEGRNMGRWTGRTPPPAQQPGGER